MQLFDFDVRSDIVVIGHDSESADLSNPTGAIHGESFYVIMTHKDGARWAHERSFVNDLNGAARLLDRVRKAYAKDGYKAIHMAHWTEIDPMYGSEAYIQAHGG